MKKFSSLILILAVTLPFNLSAQKPNSIKGFVQDYFQNKSTKGLSIGIYSEGEIDYFNFGVVSDIDSVPPTEESIYEIGSITKTFTGLAFAQMIEEGLVQYDDPISKYLPEDVVHWDPSFAISLGELATHSSGFPRIPDNLFPLAMRNPNNPYKDYTKEDLYAYLKDYTPIAKDKRKASYSNLGMGLLGDILADIEDTDFAGLIKKRISEKLEMENTYMGYKEGKQITGHNGFGEATDAWESQCMQGAGAIRSNCIDMMKYLVANLHAEGPMQDAHSPRVTTESKTKYGLAWISLSPKSDIGEILFHNGGTGGFRTAILISKKHQTGVVVLSNNIESVDALGMQILGLISK